MSIETLTQSKFTATAGKLIILDLAHMLINAHKADTDRRAGTVDSYFFGKDQIQNLLDHPKAVGIRIHFGIDENGINKLILFPADGNGNELYVKNSEGLDAGLDFGLPCPPQCPTDTLY